ncbi:MAG: hypothetical protein Q9227_003788 [Pyrenula ochraceoflavens]
MKRHGFGVVYDRQYIDPLGGKGADGVHADLGPQRLASFPSQLTSRTLSLGSKQTQNYHHASNGASDLKTRSVSPLSGSKLLSTKSVSVPRAEWTAATLRGVVTFEGNWYAMTALHPFMLDGETSQPDDSEASDKSASWEQRDYHSHQKNSIFNPTRISDTEHLDLDDNVEENIDTVEPCEDPWSKFPSFSQNFQVFLCDTLGTGTRQLGGYKPEDYCLRGWNDRSLASLKHDYALIPLDSIGAQTELNTILLPNNEKILVRRVNTNSRKPPDQVIIAGSVSGVQEVPISGTLTSFSFPWWREAVNVLTINVSLERGDSGAWVVDREGILYGMVIATVPSLEISYMVRAQDIFCDILNGNDDFIKMAYILPSNIKPFDVKVAPPTLISPLPLMIKDSEAKPLTTPISVPPMVRDSKLESHDQHEPESHDQHEPESHDQHEPESHDQHEPESHDQHKPESHDQHKPESHEKHHHESPDLHHHESHDQNQPQRLEQQEPKSLDQQEPESHERQQSESLDPYHAFSNYPNAGASLNVPYCDGQGSVTPRVGMDSYYSRSPGLICLYPGCEGLFARPADLSRHYRTVHFIERLYDCPWERCEQKGIRGFTRKDHLIEHRRNYHMEGR